MDSFASRESLSGDKFKPEGHCNDKSKPGRCMNTLTAGMPRDAATWLWPNHDHMRLEFMCHALVDSLYATGLGDAVKTAFCALLVAHDVDRGGNLEHEGRSYYSGARGRLPAWRVQNHRFDFLNLLACELENP
jgi:hypothetical protein